MANSGSHNRFWGVVLAVFLTALTIFGSVVLMTIAFEVQLIFLKISRFLPAPPPGITNTLDLNPEGYHQEWDFFTHSNLWANLASIFTTLALIFITVAIHVDKRLSARPRNIVGLLCLSLVFLAGYFVAINQFTITYDGSFLDHARGQRFVVGLNDTPFLKAYREDDPTSSISTIIDDFPERIDGLWEPSSVQAAFALLGLLYVLTTVSFASTLIIAADLCLVMVVGVFKHHGGNGLQPTTEHVAKCGSS